MAKTAKDKAATPAPAAISIANLPADLMTLVNQTAESLKLVAAGVVALETSEGAEKATVTDNLAAATAQVEQLHAAIDAWFDSYVRDRLAAADEQCEAELENRNRDLAVMLQSADDEATRQLDEKRAALAQHLAEAEARADADLADMLEQKNTTASEDGTGGDDLVAPSTGLVTVTVIGPAKGLRRAGFQFGAEPQTVQVTAEQKAIIEADLLLAMTAGATATSEQRGKFLARLAIGDFEFSEAGPVDVVVLGPTKGRRRAGFSFTDTAQTVSVTKEQLMLLLEDDELAVQPA